MDLWKSLPTVENYEPEDKTLKEEHRQLKSNFERLNTLFQDTLEELDSIKADYKSKPGKSRMFDQKQSFILCNITQRIFRSILKSLFLPYFFHSRFIICINAQ